MSKNFKFQSLQFGCAVFFVFFSSIFLNQRSVADEIDTAAKLKYFSGIIEIKNQTGKIIDQPTVGQLVPQGSVVITRDKSVVLIELPDHSMIKVNSNSEIALEQFRKVGEKKTDSTRLNLISGGVFTKVSKQPPKTQFYLKTRQAVMGVRGTEFYASFGKPQGDVSDFWMCVKEGEVSIEAEIDKKAVSVKQGEGVFLPAGKSVTPPKPYAWTRNLNWNMEPSSGEVMDKSSINAAYLDLLNQNYD